LRKWTLISNDKNLPLYRVTRPCMTFSMDRIVQNYHGMTSNQFGGSLFHLRTHMIGRTTDHLRIRRLTLLGPALIVHLNFWVGDRSCYLLHNFFFIKRYSPLANFMSIIFKSLCTEKFYNTVEPPWETCTSRRRPPLMSDRFSKHRFVHRVKLPKKSGHDHVFGWMTKIKHFNNLKTLRKTTLYFSPKKNVFKYFSEAEFTSSREKILN